MNTLNNDRAAYRIGFNAGGGFIMPHHPNMLILQKGHVKSMELSFEKIANGSKLWHHTYNYPSFGYSYQFFDLGADELIGNAHAVNLFLKIGVINKRRYSIYLKPAFGLGYIEKVFDPIDNFKNVSISSKINALIQLQGGIQTYFNSKVNFNSSVNFTHFSNGAITKPNQGINMPSIYLGLTYGIGKIKTYPFKESLAIDKKTYYWASLSATIKQLYPAGGPNYSAYIMTAGRYKNLNQMLDWGIGMDLTYDNSIREVRKREDMEYENFIYGTRGGIHLGLIANINKVGALFNLGYYAFNHSTDNYSLYKKLGLRFAVSERIFAGVNLKTHYARADLLEWNIGWKFNGHEKN